MDTNSKTMKTVYTVVERSPGKSYWIRIGIGFVNNDGSMNLKLDALPVNGTIQVRDWEPADARRGNAEHATNGDNGHRARDPIAPLV